MERKQNVLLQNKTVSAQKTLALMVMEILLGRGSPQKIVLNSGNSS